MSPYRRSQPAAMGRVRPARQRRGRGTSTDRGTDGGRRVWHTQMTIVHPPQSCTLHPNLAITHPQSWRIPPIHLILPIWSNWGCNQAPNSVPYPQFGTVGGRSQDWGYNEAPQFCIIPPIWSIGGISQDWGWNQAPQLCTDPQFGPIGGISQDWGYNQAPQLCTIPPIWSNSGTS